jgi:DNA topoisomerase I
MKVGESLTRKAINADQHFTEPPPRYSEASLVKRMEELGIGRPSTYASILQVLQDRSYVRIEKKRLHAEDRGLLVTSFLENFFKRYVEYDFTAGLEEKLDLVSSDDLNWKDVLRDFWRDFSAAVGETKDLRTSQVLDVLNEELGAHIFPTKTDGTSPRACPSCSEGILSLKLGKFGAFIGCSNYPECRFTRQLAATGEDGSGEDGEGTGQSGVKVLGKDEASGFDVTLRDGRFGAYVQLGEGEKPKRQSLPKAVRPAQVDLELALKLLSLPRHVADHPETGKPILASIGRYGPYVQHESMYANLGADDDVLEIGANRAIDLIVAKEQGKSEGGLRRGGRVVDPGKVLGEDPESGKSIALKAGRFGAYVTDGTVNATLPRSMSQEAITFDEALALIRAKQASGPAPKRGRKSLLQKARPNLPASQKQMQNQKPRLKPKRQRPPQKDKAFYRQENGFFELPMGIVSSKG